VAGDVTIALGLQGDRQTELMVTWREMRRSPGYFFDRLYSQFALM
jgi:hypothetical protein